MDLLALIALLLTIAMPVMIIVTLVKVGNIQREIEDIKISLLRLSVSGKEKKGEAKKEEVVTPNQVEPPLLPVSAPEPEPIPEIVPKPEPIQKLEPEPMPETPSTTAPEPVFEHVKISEVAEMSVFDLFWARFEDWVCVRGDFAPKGMTREFAIATRWLTRVGAVLLVGAIAYFLVLAIDKGWIGPVQRVYGMMAWGVIGTVFGTWLKLKSERYAILGEVCAAVGLVAMYLSFGLGHRYFKPPVIASGYVAFAGLFVATVAAGILSVRLKSLMIAGLALVGGFLVPAICSFTDHGVQLHSYLLVLSLGACTVAFIRGWTGYGFAAIAVALGMGRCGHGGDEFMMSYFFIVAQFAQFMALTVVVARRANQMVRGLVWAAAALMSLAGLGFSSVVVNEVVNVYGNHFVKPLHYSVWAATFAVLSAFSRRRNWGGTPVLIVFSCASTLFALGTACFEWWHLNDATVIFLFGILAALLSELGVRSRERTLQVISLAATVVLSVIGFGYFAYHCTMAGNGYVRDLIDRIQYLWSIPALVAFTGRRLGERELWSDWLRPLAFGVAAVMAFVVVTIESHFFGHEFLPVLRGGFVTITWSVAASAFLAVGIVRRVKASRLVGLGVLALSVVKLLLVDTASLATPGRVGVFAAVGVLLIAGAFLYLKFKPLFEAESVTEEKSGE